MKTLFKFAFVAAIVAVVGYNVYQSQSVMNGMSDFALANVNALASGESDDDYEIVPCPDSYANQCIRSKQGRPSCPSPTRCP